MKSEITRVAVRLPRRRGCLPLFGKHWDLIAPALAYGNAPQEAQDWSWRTWRKFTSFDCEVYGLSHLF